MTRKFRVVKGSAAHVEGKNEYIPSSSVEDHGVDVTDSVKHIVDEIGTTKSATIRFIHDKTSNTTTYHFSTAETIPSNIKIIVEHGARLEGPVTLTINGPFEAGLYQVFGSSITVSFGAGAVTEFQAAWWSWDTSATAANNATYLNKAVTALPTKGVLDLGYGSYSVDSATIAALAGDSIAIPNDDITIRCKSKHGVKIILSGASECGIFKITEKNGFKCENIYFYGNNQASADSVVGSAIWFYSNSATDYKGFDVHDCKFENFKGARWVGGTLISTGHLTKVRIERNELSGGGDRDSSDAGVAAHQIYFNGSSTGRVKDAWIKDNYCEGSAIKCSIAFIDVGESGKISGNACWNNGQTSSSENAYAVLLYNGGTRWRVHDNELYNPETCGIYALNQTGLNCHHNYVYSQDETDDSTLLRGGIACAQIAKSNISNNILESCYFGIQVQPATTQANVSLNGNVYESCTYALRLRAHSSANSKGININHETIRNCTYGINWITLGYDIDYLKISNCIIEGATYGIYGGTLASHLPHLAIVNNDIEASNSGIHMLTAGADFKVIGNSIYGDLSGYGIALQGSAGGTIKDNSLYDITTGSGMWLHSVEGYFWGNHWHNVTTPIATTAGEDLGLETPTFSADNGTYVQKYKPDNLDGSNRTYLGWVMVNGTWEQIWISDRTW